MLPYYKQETDFYCGPAVVQMLFAGRGVMMTQVQLAEALGTTAGAGTSLEAIVHILSLHGFETKHKNGASLADIAEALGAGKSALVGYTETENQEPHYALVAELGKEEVVLIDPHHGERYALPINTFEEQWRDNERHMYGERALVTVA